MYGEFSNDWGIGDKLEYKVLRCGEYLTDDDYIASTSWQGLKFSVRVRIISYEDVLYYHKMIDGEVVEFKKIGVVE